MNLKIFAPNDLPAADFPTQKKMVIISPESIKVKTEFKGKIAITNYNFSLAKEGILYKSTPFEHPEVIGNFIDVERSNDLISVGMSHAGGSLVDETYTDFSTPIFAHVADGETETDEPATETIYFPPPETPLQFIERISARLFNVTHRIAILRHEEPHQNALSKNICREVPADHDEVLRYDISNNLIKRPVGWIALQIENYENRYKRHLTAVETAKSANRAIPNFNDATDRSKIETMLEKVEESLTEECLRDHFDLHRTRDWNPIQNTERKITLCNDDANRTPGEVLVDVNAFFTDGRGRIAQEHAKKTYHDISTLYWVKAKRTSHRKLVTERIIDLS